MTEFTKGPWKCHTGAGCRSIYNDESGDIAHTDGISNDEEDQANAYLLAAAPELFTACNRALGALERNHTIDWGLIYAAVAKALGPQ